jgi:hypothetical protein
VAIIQSHDDEDRVVAQVWGGHGLWRVRRTVQGWWSCSCLSQRPHCSHVLATMNECERKQIPSS